jgi:hypothetical protein
MADLLDCPAETDIERLADGTLEGEHVGAVERHLAQCRSCSNRHDRLFNELIGLLRGCRDGETHPEQLVIDRLASLFKALTPAPAGEETLGTQGTPSGARSPEKFSTVTRLVSPLTIPAMNSEHVWRTTDASSDSSTSTQMGEHSDGCIQARKPTHGS